MYEVVIRPELAPVFDNLKIKDPKAYQNIKKKIEQVSITLELNPNHCKNLNSTITEV